MSKFNTCDLDMHYVKKVKAIPMLSLEDEVALTQDWQQTQNPKSAEKLINAHLKLVLKIANGYRGYGLPLSDLIAEGNIGMMHAMKHFDPAKGFRVSTYASWWIRASIQQHILNAWSLVRLGTTTSQRKLFFSLKKTQRAIQMTHEENDQMSPEVIIAVADKLKVSPRDVEHMAQRLTKDSSLNTKISTTDEGSNEWIEWLSDERENAEISLMQRDEMQKRQALLDKVYSCLTEREKEILKDRRLTEPPLTLEAVASKHQISMERVRQIEHNIILKLQKQVRLISPKDPRHI